MSTGYKAPRERGWIHPATSNKSKYTSDTERDPLISIEIHNLYDYFILLYLTT